MLLSLLATEPNIITCCSPEHTRVNSPCRTGDNDIDKSSNDGGDATTVGTVIDTLMTNVERFHHGPPVCHSSSSRRCTAGQCQRDWTRELCGMLNKKETDYMHGCLLMIITIKAIVFLVDVCSSRPCVDMSKTRSIVLRRRRPVTTMSTEVAS
jgi:hypothetical protein